VVIASRHPSSVDDQRIGAALRALRVRRALRQRDAAGLAGIPRPVVMQVEAGRLDRVRFGDIRRFAAALGARFDGSVLWQGADLDRMIHRGHARMHEATIRWLHEIGGWLAVPEVSFAIGRDRGVIDIVAWHAASRSLLVIEIKTRIADVGDLMATMDIRARVARQIARDRGWDPAAIGVWVLLAPGRTNARVLAEYAGVLRAKFPADGRSIRRWLATPLGSIAALSFLPQGRVGDLGRDIATPKRVRRGQPRSTTARIGRSDGWRPRIGVAFHD
jgi:transcriptional regulator with XRE-family HTH domain